MTKTIVEIDFHDDLGWRVYISHAIDSKNPSYSTFWFEDKPKLIIHKMEVDIENAKSS